MISKTAQLFAEKPNLVRQEFLFAEIERRFQKTSHPRRIPECRKIRQLHITFADLHLSLRKIGTEIQRKERPRQKVEDVRIVAPPRKIKDTTPWVLRM